MRKTLSPRVATFVEYVMVLIGAAIIATSFNIFLLPNKIASGGVSGVSTILDHAFGLEPAFVQWAFNIPLFILGFVLIGRQFGIKTLVGTLSSPFFVYITSGLEPATTNPLLAALFGGIGIGVGLGICFRANGSTGGTDIVAQIVNKYTGLPLGTSIAMIDAVVVGTASVVFSLEAGMYALIALFVTGKTINTLQVGFGYSKMCLIISNKEDEVKQALLYEVNRGVTKLQAEGGFTNESRPVLMCVVNTTQFTKVRKVVKKIDPQAFIVTADATEVLGEGFKNI